METFKRNLLNFKDISKISFYSSILIISILLSVSIIKEYISHTHYAEYQDALKEKEQDIRSQISLLKKAVESSPSNPDMLFKLGKAYIKEMSIVKDRKEKIRSYRNAKKSFQEALLRKPTYERFWAAYAWYIGHNGEVENAITYFDYAICLGPIDAYVHSLYARWCIYQIKKEISIEDSVNVIKAGILKQEFDEILQTYENRFIDGLSIAFYLNLARREWNAALSLGIHKDQTVNSSLADLNLLSYEFDKAIEYYKHAGNKIMLLRCYFIKREYPKAFRILESIVTNEASQKDLIKTQRLLVYAIQEDSENYRSFYWLGEVYTKLGMSEKAIKSYQILIELKPKYTEVHLKLAKLFELTGKIGLAIKEYEKILSLNPRHKEAAGFLRDAIRENYKDVKPILK